jgi:hypothetical protein
MSNQSVKHSDLKIFLDTHNDSSNTLKKDNARYLFTLPQPIVLASTDEHHIKMGIEQMTLPITCYSINDSNNVFKINSNTYTLTEGNYNVETFLSHLNILLGSLATVTFNETNNKITFTSSSPLTFHPSSANRLIGYHPSLIAKPLIYQCESSISLIYSANVTVRLNNISTLNMDGNGSSGTLLRLPINTSGFTSLSHLSSNPLMTTISQTAITQIDISLLADDGTLLRIQDHPWSIVLRVEFELATAYFLKKSKIESMRDVKTKE